MDETVEEINDKRILCQFKSESGEPLGTQLDLPYSVTHEHLQIICRTLLQQDESALYAFYVEEKEINNCLVDVLDINKLNTEHVVDIIYQEQAVFRVRPVTRCTSTLPGHAEAVVVVKFSPDGSQLASGSGDTTVRLWDIHTQTPHHTLQGHPNWVLSLAWSPDGTRLASGCKSGRVMTWDANSGKKLAQMSGHKQWITGITWEPFHLNTTCRRFASSSKDGDVRIWDAITGRCERTISGHTMSVTAVIWGGSGLIYTSSQDRSVKVWRSSDGVLCKSLLGHAHWVNTLALSTEYILRTGAVNFHSYDHNSKSLEEKQQEAVSKYKMMCDEDGGERLVSGSDDFTLFLWKPETDKKPIARMTGHQQLINHVQFSPDGRLIASASFDKSVKIWDGRTGKYLTVLRGHVQAVYMVAWSADSRLLVSGSADSTLKLWNLKDRKLQEDLPGHADQVFAVDWAPDGSRVASGGKDKILRLWQH